MSRGPGRWQRELLARIKKLKPNDPREGVGWFYLASVLPDRPSVGSDHGALRRAARRLAEDGRLILEGASDRRLVVEHFLGPRSPEDP